MAQTRRVITSETAPQDAVAAAAMVFAGGRARLTDVLGPAGVGDSFQLPGRHNLFSFRILLRLPVTSGRDRNPLHGPQFPPNGNAD
jgi:hypothetical protein